MSPSAVVQLALVTSVLLSVPATALVFTVRDARRPGAGAGAEAGAGRRVPAALRPVVGAVAVAVGAVLVGAVLGARPASALVVAVGLGASVLAWTPVGRPWATRGLVAWSLALDAGALYLAYVLGWTLTADLSPAGTVASLVLWVLELFVFVLGVGYVWEFVDVVTRRTWPRYVDPATLAAAAAAVEGAHRPFVSLHVPTHNEPPDLVIATLQRLLQLDYDAYEVLLVDNNTTDPALWEPVEAFCATDDRLVFLHLENWPGFKSGALNHALTRTDPRAEVIGIVDADYLVEPDFLADCAPLFADPGIAFVQTPQDYRDWEQASYFRRLYYSYGYFFDVSQRSRNERNAAIFGGTMGLIRRSALEAAGGWDEWCITEDAELSLRLLKRGGHGLHVDRSYGHGVMPLTFEALKRQRFRWCFGGIQILRMHWRSLLPGRRTPENQMSFAQRWGYLVGGLQWFGDLAGLLFTAFLLLGAADLVLGAGLVARRLSGFLLLAVVALMVLGILRSLALVRRTSGASWREALGAFGLWTALGLTVARASARGLVAREGVFLRTPKVRGQLRPRYALVGNLGETAIAAVCLLLAGAAAAQASASGAVVALLLTLQGLGHASAPLNSLAAIRADLPAELERRRRTMLASWGRPARRGGLLVGLTGVALAALVVAASPIGSPPLSRLRLDLPTDPGPAGTGARTPARTSSDQPAAGVATSGADTPVGVLPAALTPTRRPGAIGLAGPTAAGTTRPAAASSSAAGSAASQTAAPSTSAAPSATPGGGATTPAAATTHSTGKPTSGPTQAASPTRPTSSPTNRPTGHPTHP